jgi:hypothetical protein
VGAAAAATVALAASPAFAGNVYGKAVGSQGWGHFYYNSRTSAYSITLVRAQAEDPLRNISSYAWRENHSGYGNTISWETSLTDSNGIWAMRIQVCTFEGDTPLSCDTSPWDGNPYYG